VTMQRTLGVTLAAAALVLAARTHAAAVGCGDTIRAGERAKLTGDLACLESPALTVEGGGELDLGGHTVTCLEDGDGVVLTGEGARLANGIVKSCLTGVVLGGDGGHRVEGVTAADHKADGFLVDGDDNVLVRNAATGNAESGFRIWHDGTGNRLARNRAAWNTDGICVGADDNVVERNRAEDNVRAGIRVLSSKTGNVVLDNVARLNGSGDLIEDLVTDCTANGWQGNAFVTRNAECLE
jgi:parallel beta-helix repeat protein